MLTIEDSYTKSTDVINICIDNNDMEFILYFIIHMNTYLSDQYILQIDDPTITNKPGLRNLVNNILSTSYNYTRRENDELTLTITAKNKNSNDHEYNFILNKDLSFVDKRTTNNRSVKVNLSELFVDTNKSVTLKLASIRTNSSRIKMTHEPYTNFIMCEGNNAKQHVERLLHKIKNYLDSITFTCINKNSCDIYELNINDTEQHNYMIINLYHTIVATMIPTQMLGCYNLSHFTFTGVTVSHNSCNVPELNIPQLIKQICQTPICVRIPDDISLDSDHLSRDDEGLKLTCHYNHANNNNGGGSLGPLPEGLCIYSHQLSKYLYPNINLYQIYKDVPDFQLTITFLVTTQCGGLAAPAFITPLNDISNRFKMEPRKYMTNDEILSEAKLLAQTIF
jgi:hypothetical protein